MNFIRFGNNQNYCLQENDYTNRYAKMGFGTFSIHLSNFNLVADVHDELDDTSTANWGINEA